MTAFSQDWEITGTSQHLVLGKFDKDASKHKEHGSTKTVSLFMGDGVYGHVIVYSKDAVISDMCFFTNSKKNCLFNSNDAKRADGIKQYRFDF